MADHSLIQMLHAHANALRGFYFDGVAAVNQNTFVCYSHTIQDAFWNYGYFAEPDNASAEDLHAVHAELNRLNRRPAFLVPSGSHLLELNLVRDSYELFSHDLWMLATSPRSAPTDQLSSLIIETVESPKSVDDALSVFSDAYTTERKDGVGYEGLPTTYTEAYREGLQHSDSFSSLHLIGYADDTPVTTASLFRSNGFAGLYNVAVSHSARRNGFGSLISRAALQGLNPNEPIFLQTEPDTPVQELYEKLGFEPVIKAEIWEHRSG